MTDRFFSLVQHSEASKGPRGPCRGQGRPGLGHDVGHVADDITISN